MNNVATKIETIREKQLQAQYLTDVLALWNVAKLAGYDDSEIRAFSFRPEFLSPPGIRNYQLSSMAQRKRFGEQFHNCVRLHNGDLCPIPITEKPIRD